MENPNTKMDDFGGYPYFRKPPFFMSRKLTYADEWQGAASWCQPGWFDPLNFCPAQKTSRKLTSFPNINMFRSVSQPLKECDIVSCFIFKFSVGASVNFMPRLKHQERSWSATKHWKRCDTIGATLGKCKRSTGGAALLTADMADMGFEWKFR